MKRKLYGNNIPPACEYCETGARSESGKVVLCPKRGIVALDFNCRKYRYDPLKRIPKKQPTLPEFSAEDFTL